jgi:hypothetical protein
MFESQHKLNFEVADCTFNIDPKIDWKMFRVGTCEGMWSSNDTSYDILAISNDVKGNGNLNDVFQWFEYSCRRDNRALRILEVWNADFKNHLINKLQFEDIGGDNLIKYFK